MAKRRTKLDKWLTDNEKTTGWLAKKIGLDRHQAYRIRHGQSGTSKDVAMKIEKATGIPWGEFIR